MQKIDVTIILAQTLDKLSKMGYTNRLKQTKTKEGKRHAS